MIVITGTMMGALLYSAAPAIIHFFGADGELAALGVQYMRVYALCSPVTTIVFAMDNYLRICGKVRLSMYLNILAAAIGVSLEFLFLFILRWGIWAAAFATCCGMFICAAIAVAVFAGGRLQLRFCRPRFSVKMIRQIIYNGSPNFLSNIAARVTEIVLNVVLMRFGGAAAVSVYGVLAYVGESLHSFLYGVCDSLQPAVGYNWGAKRHDRVKSIEKCCFTASAFISVLSALLMFMFPEQITSLFVKDGSREFVKYTVMAMRIYSLTFLTRWLSFATQSFMTAVGRSGYATVLSVSTALVFPLSMIALLWPLELTGIWLNFPLTYALAAVLAGLILLRFRKEFKREP